METNSNGDPVLTQWFERGRFEWYPNNPQGFRVLLGLLGNEMRQAVGVRSSVLYLDDNALYELTLDGTSERRQSVPDMGRILDAVDSGNQIVVLREQGLQRLSATQPATTIATFTKGLARFGALVDPLDTDKLVYEYMRDANTAMGLEGVAGIIERGATARKVLDAPNAVHVLGLTTDEKAMYVIDRGGDPSFVRIRVVQIPTGETLADLPIAGEGAAAESPDRRTIATVGQRSGANDLLQLYDLTTQDVRSRVVSLPRRGWYAHEVVWSRDSRSMYVTMYPSADRPTGELYRIDAASGASDLITASLPSDTHLLSIAPDGRKLLAREMAGIAVIDLANGTVKRQALPADAIVARWH
jgi:hypothetical protein